MTSTKKLPTPPAHPTSPPPAAQPQQPKRRRAMFDFEASEVSCLFFTLVPSLLYSALALALALLSPAFLSFPLFSLLLFAPLFVHKLFSTPFSSFSSLILSSFPPLLLLLCFHYSPTNCHFTRETLSQCWNNFLTASGGREN